MRTRNIFNGGTNVMKTELYVSVGLDAVCYNGREAKFYEVGKNFQIIRVTLGLLDCLSKFHDWP